MVDARGFLIVGGLVAAAVGVGCAAFGGASDAPEASAEPTAGDGGAGPAADGAVVPPVPGADGGGDSSADAATRDWFVFLTRAAYAGNFRGGDPCAVETNNTASLAGRRFIPWATSTAGSPKARLGAGRFVLPTKNAPLVVAASAEAFASKSHERAIDVDPTGTPLAPSAGDSLHAWTGLTDDGTTLADSCGGFTTSAGQGVVGDATTAGPGWAAEPGTEVGSFVTRSCAGAMAHVYCVEVPDL